MRINRFICPRVIRFSAGVKLESLKTKDIKVYRERLETLQVNLGYKCNQACTHCHVNAGPNRTEEMARETIEVILRFLKKERIQILDITGGAPELNPHFKYLVTEAAEIGVCVINRCNLTILLEKGHVDLPLFFAEKKVKVVASMPCYTEENVNKQRGHGVFDKSIQGLKKLNEVGYGHLSSGLVLDLVYNPLGATLPPDPKPLELEYREKFLNMGVKFNNLLTMTNMPISRFKNELNREGALRKYEKLLRDNFESTNLKKVMCRSTLSVDWRGNIYDCDFNQMIGLSVEGVVGRHLSEVDIEGLCGKKVRIEEHCFGCFAGRGSGCGGALAT